MGRRGDRFKMSQVMRGNVPIRLTPALLSTGHVDRPAAFGDADLQVDSWAAWI